MTDPGEVRPRGVVEHAQSRKPSPELSPNRYIEKVSLTTGEVLDDDILPRQLLVSGHLDYHPADIQARRFMSRLMRATGDEEMVVGRMKELRKAGHRAAEMVARAVGQRDPEKVSKALFGLKRKEYYFRYKKPAASREEIEALLAEMQGDAAEKLQKVTEGDGIRFLLPAAPVSSASRSCGRRPTTKRSPRS